MTQTETITITETHTSYKLDYVAFLVFGVIFTLIGIAVGKFIM